MATLNQLVLNYHDAMLYESDLSILKSSSSWLNDACINFYLTFLQQNHSSSNSCDEGSSMMMKFIDPSVITFLMHQCDDEEDMEEFSNSFDKSYKIYTIPINNGHDKKSTSWMTPSGGSHWSLLVVVQLGNDDNTNKDGKEIKFLHFDSIEGSNCSAARQVSETFAMILLGKKKAAAAPSKVVMEAVKTPQQNNGYDCGIYALSVAEILVENITLFFEDSTILVDEISKYIFKKTTEKNAHFALDMRRKIFKTALELMK